MKQAGHHHANSLAQQINSNIEHELSQRDSQMLAMVQSIPSLVESSSQSEDSQEDHDQHVASDTSQDNTQLQILRLMQEIQRSLPKPSTDGPNDRRNRNQLSRRQMIVLSGELTLASTAGPMDLVVILVKIFLAKNLVIRKKLHLVTKRAVLKQGANDGVSRV